MEHLESIYNGVIKLGDYEIPCYVLNDEQRVLSQREVVKLITGGRESGDLSRYLSAKSVHPFLPDKFKNTDNSLNILPGTQSREIASKPAINMSYALIFNTGTRTVKFQFYYSSINSRVVIDDILMKLLEGQFISIEMFLEHSSYPFADKILQSIKKMRKEAAQGQMPEGMPTQLLQQIQQEAGQATPEQLAQAEKLAGYNRAV